MSEPKPPCESCSRPGSRGLFQAHDGRGICQACFVAENPGLDAGKAQEAVEFMEFLEWADENPGELWEALRDGVWQVSLEEARADIARSRGATPPESVQ